MQVPNKIKAVKERKSYGNITVNSKDNPDIKNLKLGEKITLEISVDIIVLRKPDKWEISEEKVSPNDVIARFDILNVVIPSKNMNKKK